MRFSLFPKASSEWSKLVNNEFWLSKFIRSFGASLPNGADYEKEYIVMEKLQLSKLYYYVVKNDYTKLLIHMLGKWKIDGLLIHAMHNYDFATVKFFFTNGINIERTNYTYEEVISLIDAYNKG